MSIGHSSSHWSNVPSPDRTNTTEERTRVYSPQSPMYDDTYSPQPELKPESYPITIEICETAVQNYNKKQRANYELVEFVSIKIIPCSDLWAHCNFTAKDISVSDEPKLFFVESKLVYRRPGVTDIIVKACQTLDGANESRCHHCQGGSPKPVAHPTRGFKTKIRDCDDERIRSLRPRPPKRSRIC